MSEPIKINIREGMAPDDLRNEQRRLIMAVAQHECCPNGCQVDGIGCKADSFREAACQSLERAIRNIEEGQ